MDFVITILFIVEALLKVVAYGFIANGSQSYLRQLSNVLDLIVIIFSMYSYLSHDSDLSKIKVLRLLRILKPLRLIARNDALKISINALIASIQQMLNLTLVCMIFFLLFGILGVNSFKGAFYYCASLPPGSYPIITKNDCLDYGGSWVNADYNFDNIIQAIITLFLLSTTEGWITLMEQGIDSVGIGYQP